MITYYIKTEIKTTISINYSQSYSNFKRQNNCYLILISGSIILFETFNTPQKLLNFCPSVEKIRFETVAYGLLPSFSREELRMR